MKFSYLYGGKAAVAIRKVSELDSGKAAVAVSEASELDSKAAAEVRKASELDDGKAAVVVTEASERDGKAAAEVRKASELDGRQTVAGVTERKAALGGGDDVGCDGENAIMEVKEASELKDRDASVDVREGSELDGWELAGVKERKAALDSSVDDVELEEIAGLEDVEAVTVTVEVIDVKATGMEEEEENRVVPCTDAAAPKLEEFG